MIEFLYSCTDFIIIVDMCYSYFISFITRVIHGANIGLPKQVLLLH
jgi:hypothetical protein